MKLNNLTTLHYHRNGHQLTVTLKADSREQAVAAMTRDTRIDVTTDNEATPQTVETLEGYRHLQTADDNGDGTYTLILTDLAPTPQDVRRQVMDIIREYDQSEAVNRFTLAGQPMWLDAETRTKLSRRLDTEEQDGATDTNLWYDARCYHLPIATVRQMLHRLEAYAIRCYDQTQWHLSNVMAMTDPEEMQAYDYTAGYPEQLSFE